ncbi:MULTISPECIES: hypothetical protein [unclassified Acinetobacter]|uniref:hypothetical protein n=1 Tax=unclassified Acinetobacter TaxID=196816 RepID=UPI002934D8B1|nr:MULTISPECIES: hypothetical protein [unclassified Acinetobacter]WOE32269.1 hypothetical protein QSG84_03390 [Acinetobacter sp. SAAs470]WOE37739.1 hypothetical protein QSG86_12435 [Acinetobacter sp. SAAs474]
MPVKHDFSISTGYIGGEDTSGDTKEKLKGFFVRGIFGVTPSINFYAEYNKQKISILKFDEVSTGFLYKFYRGKKINGSIGSGIGYVWLNQQLKDPNLPLTADLKLKYISIPLFIEGEIKLSEHFSYFGNLSYQWLFNYDSKVCLTVISRQTICNLIHENSDSLVYKLGIRYSF